MRNFTLSLTTKQEFDKQVNSLLSSNPSQPLYVNITKKPKKRSLSANAQQHVWYGQVAEYHDDQIPLDIKRVCKIMFGLQITLASKKLEPVASFLIEKLNYYRYSYENKLKLMDVIVHTSEFSTKESNKYMEQILNFYNSNGLNIGYQDD